MMITINKKVDHIHGNMKAHRPRQQHNNSTVKPVAQLQKKNLFEKKFILTLADQFSVARWREWISRFGKKFVWNVREKKERLY